MQCLILPDLGDPDPACLERIQDHVQAEDGDQSPERVGRSADL